MLRLIIIVFIFTGLWWWLIGNKTLEDGDASQTNRVNWTATASEAAALGSSGTANQCLVESMLKSRLCSEQDTVCTTEINVYASACLESTSDLDSWCELLPSQDSKDFEDWPD